MERIDQRPTGDNPGGPDSPVSLGLLLDLLAPLPLVARELEAGLPGSLKGVGDGR